MMQPPREQSGVSAGSKVSTPLNQLARYFDSTASHLRSLTDCARQLAECIKAILPVAGIRIGTYQGGTGLVKWQYADHTPTTADGEPGIRPEEAVREAIERREILVRNSSTSGCRMVAPLVRGPRVLGIVDIQTTDDTPCCSDTLASLNILCAHFGLMVENVDLKANSKHVESDMLEKEIRKNQKLQSIIDVARSIAHELNQPLTGIGGYCTLIREDVSEDHAIMRDIDEIMKQSARLEELVHRFQNITHVEYDETSLGKSGA